MPLISFAADSESDTVILVGKFWQIMTWFSGLIGFAADSESDTVILVGRTAYRSQKFEIRLGSLGSPRLHLGKFWAYQF